MRQAQREIYRPVRPGFDLPARIRAEFMQKASESVGEHVYTLPEIIKALKSAGVGLSIRVIDRTRVHRKNLRRLGFEIETSSLGVAYDATYRCHKSGYLWPKHRPDRVYKHSDVIAYAQWLAERKDRLGKTVLSSLPENLGYQLRRIIDPAVREAEMIV